VGNRAVGHAILRNSVPAKRSLPFGEVNGHQNTVQITPTGVIKKNRKQNKHERITVGAVYR
jgi:hypothetical protein